MMRWRLGLVFALSCAAPLAAQEVAPPSPALILPAAPDGSQMAPSGQGAAAANGAANSDTAQPSQPEGAAPAAVPQAMATPILTLDQEQMFQESLWGKAVLARIDIEASALSAENRRIEAELEAEERALTEQRSKMNAAEFTALAQAFDLRVEETRRAQELKSRDITRKLEDDRQTFLREALPALGELMARKGASVILAESALILSRSDIDATAEAIALIDQRLPAPVAAPSAEPELDPAPAPVPETAAPIAPETGLDTAPTAP